MQPDLDNYRREYDRLKAKEEKSGKYGRIHYAGPEYEPDDDEDNE